MRRILILLLLGFACHGVLGQKQVLEQKQVQGQQSERRSKLNPADYVYPVRDAARLYSANFGEMRPGHFHAGVDFKTDGAEGKALVAVADGYVSRISIGTFGYGRAIYITLANGTTAVYGHLQRFRADIEKHAREERYSRRSNSLNLWFEPDRWPVKQGDVIAYSGNSGSSFGPHLHFELRDTRTQWLYNIIREGVVRPVDDLPPRIMHVHYIEVDTLQGVPVHNTPQSYAVVRSAQGHYRLTREEPVEVGRKGYFVVEASDRRNDVHNTFGLWRASIAVDGLAHCEYRIDGFMPDMSRCCDAVSYYPLQLTSRNEVIRLAQLAAAPGCFYPVMKERGLIRTLPAERHHIRIEAEDDCGNISHLEFDIRGRQENFKPRPDSLSTILRPDKASVIRLGHEVTARIPAGALYEPLFCRPERCEAPRSDSALVILSPAYRILDVTTPLRNAMTVSVRAFVPENLQSRTVLAARNVKGSISYVGGKYANGAVAATTRTTGELFVVADTIPPRITPLFTNGADLTRAESLRFKVSDNFSGIASCTLLIDGKWVPCDRHPVQGTLTHTFDTLATSKRDRVQPSKKDMSDTKLSKKDGTFAPTAGGRHRIRLTLKDGCGNTSQWEGEFCR